MKTAKNRQWLLGFIGLYVIHLINNRIFHSYFVNAVTLHQEFMFIDINSQITIVCLILENI